jgi:hypothetical protein
MDWIGGKLAMLIEEGKKALGKEVVVMSDAKEDEVDDGTGTWEEEEGGDREREGNGNRAGSSGSRTQSRSMTIPRPSEPTAPMSYSYSSPAWYRGSEMPPSPSYGPSRSYQPGSSLLHGQFSRSPGGEGMMSQSLVDEGVSPEVREYMDRARARYQNRG